MDNEIWVCIICHFISLEIQSICKSFICQLRGFHSWESAIFAFDWFRRAFCRRRWQWCCQWDEPDWGLQPYLGECDHWNHVPSSHHISWHRLCLWNWRQQQPLQGFVDDPASAFVWTSCHPCLHHLCRVQLCQEGVPAFICFKPHQRLGLNISDWKRELICTGRWFPQFIGGNLWGKHPGNHRCRLGINSWFQRNHSLICQPNLKESKNFTIWTLLHTAIYKHHKCKPVINAWTTQVKSSTAESNNAWPSSLASSSSASSNSSHLKHSSAHWDSPTSTMDQTSPTSTWLLPLFKALQQMGLYILDCYRGQTCPGRWFPQTIERLLIWWKCNDENDVILMAGVTSWLPT